TCRRPLVQVQVRPLVRPPSRLTLDRSPTVGHARGAMIAVRNVHKVFRQGDVEIPALAGVSLDVTDGEFVSIMGPSGSGKSTLLHLMGGLDAPSAGEIVIDGTAIS